MDYNEDNIENTKRSSKGPPEETSLSPVTDEYYADNRVLIPDNDSVRSLTIIYLHYFCISDLFFIIQFKWTLHLFVICVKHFKH